MSMPPEPPQGPPQPPYGNQGWPGQDPMAPWGRHPVTGEPYSEKSKLVAGLLQLLLTLLCGLGGIGRLYMGHTAIGLVQLLGMIASWILSIVLIGIPFLIGLWLWALVDGIMILAGSDVRDASGRLLRP